MKIKIKQPVALHETGSRSINEDFIYPLHNQANPTEQLFVVCDGEGGANVGEVASKLVALSFAKYFATTPPRGDLDQAYLDGALQTAEEALTAYQEAHPSSKNMASTLALLYFGEHHVTLAWVGNTQVYYYNAHTQELHSPSQEKGNPAALISGSNKPQSISVRHYAYARLHQGDYFLLATDGLTEKVNQEALSTILKGKHYAPLASVKDEIRSLIADETQDNYSCYVIQIDQVQQETDGAVSDVASTQTQGTGRAATDDTPLSAPAENSLGRNILVGGLMLLVVSLVGWLIYRSFDNPYGQLMAEGDESMRNREFRKAKELYSEAYNVEDNSDRERENASNMTIMARDSMEANGMSEMAIGARGSVETLILSAQGSFDNKAYVAAIGSWEQAQQQIIQAGGSDTILPLATLVQAYIYAGNDAFDRTPRDQETATTYYARASSLLARPRLVNFDSNLREQLDERMAILDMAPTQPQNPLADNSTTRRVASRSVEPAPEKPEKKTATTTSKPNARVAPTPSTIDGSTKMSAEQRTELDKNLSTGKRLFTQAKEQNSDYLYKMSAEKLAASGTVIDGSGAYLLGYLYHNGLGVKANKDKALRYAQLSARKNWPSGQYLYGYLLLLRENPRDTVTALQSLQLSANQNYLSAVELLQQLK